MPRRDDDNDMCIVHTRSTRASSLTQQQPRKDEGPIDDQHPQEEDRGNGKCRYYCYHAFTRRWWWLSGGLVIVFLSMLAILSSSSSASSSTATSSFHLVERITRSLLWRKDQASSSSSIIHENLERAYDDEAEATTAGEGVGESHQFAVVIDGGSTGSRMFVYR